MLAGETLGVLFSRPWLSLAATHRAAATIASQKGSRKAPVTKVLMLAFIGMNDGKAKFTFAEPMSGKFTLKTAAANTTITTNPMMKLRRAYKGFFHENASKSFE
jgi:hypothetical protein